MKTFILGLDGATFDQLNPLIDEGFLPNIKEMCDEFTHGSLETVFPPVTAPAWLALATGLNPGKTGVFDYINKSSDNSEAMLPISSTSYKNRALWNYLNKNGYEAAIFNYPTLSPPPRIKGCVVSGMGAQKHKSLCYPDKLNQEIASITSNYEVRLNLRNRKYKKDLQLFFNDIYRIIENQSKVLFHLIKNKKWDFFFAVFSFTDWIQHVLWKDIDENHPMYNTKTSPPVHQQYKNLWQKVDQIIGEILSILPAEINFIIVSDHGSGPLDSVFYPNTWLLKEGWLKKKKTLMLKSLIADTFTTLSESYDNKYTNNLTHFFKKRILKIKSTMDLIDMDNTLAYSPEHNTMFGCINLTSKGKAQAGFKDELIKELQSLPEKYSGIISVHVLLPEQIYSGPYTNLSPDILFVVNDYHSTVEIPFTKKVFELHPSIDLRTGGHRSNGVFIARGDVFKNTSINPSILDIAPTILALYDVEIPEKMDGKVLTECIKPEVVQAMNIRYGKGLDDTDDQVEDKGDLEEMKDLLKSLGYM